MPLNYSDHIPLEHRRQVLDGLRSNTLLEIYRQCILLGINPDEMSKDWDMDEAGFTESNASRQTAENLTGLLGQLSMIERLISELQ